MQKDVRCGFSWREWSVWLTFKYLMRFKYFTSCSNKRLPFFVWMCSCDKPALYKLSHWPRPLYYINKPNCPAHIRTTAETSVSASYAPWLWRHCVPNFRSGVTRGVLIALVGSHWLDALLRGSIRSDWVVLCCSVVSHMLILDTVLWRSNPFDWTPGWSFPGILIGHYF